MILSKLLLDNFWMTWLNQATPYAGAFMASPAWPMYMPSYMQAELPLRLVLR